MNAPVEEVEKAIRISGLSNLKASRIQSILRQIKQQRGKIDLQFLSQMKDREAFEYLIRFNGVGPKTAHCTLLFAFGKAMFPVDTHIHRIARRLQIVNARATAEQTQRVMEPNIAPKDRYELHVLMIEHGRRTCRAINPKCDVCPLLSLCPFGKLRVLA